MKFIFLFVKMLFKAGCHIFFRAFSKKNHLYFVNSQNLSTTYKKMVDKKLDAVPLVDIDDEGIFKYVLIKVYGKEKADGSEPNKNIVRGFSRAQWHSDIYDEVSESIMSLGLDTECLGGGRIDHQPDHKKIKVYGYSQGYGKADHSISKEILKTKYCDYTIEISDDGY